MLWITHLIVSLDRTFLEFETHRPLTLWCRLSNAFGGGHVYAISVQNPLGTRIIGMSTRVFLHVPQIEMPRSLRNPLKSRARFVPPRHTLKLQLRPLANCYGNGGVRPKFYVCLLRTTLYKTIQWAKYPWLSGGQNTFQDYNKLPFLHWRNMLAESV